MAKTQTRVPASTVDSREQDPAVTDHAADDILPTPSEVHSGQVVDRPDKGQVFDITRYGPAARALIEYIAEAARATEDEDVVIAEQLAAQILSAEDTDAILDPFGVIHGRDLIGRNLSVHGVRFLESDYAEGLPWYAVADVEDPRSGNHYAVTMGGSRVLMQFAGLHRLNDWPQVMTLLKADRPTKKGFYPLRLEKPHV